MRANIRITHKESPGNNQIFEASGKVVWNKLADDSSGNYETGIDFTAIDLAALSLFLKQAGVLADDSSG